MNIYLSIRFWKFCYHNKICEIFVTKRGGKCIIIRNDFAHSSALPHACALNGTDLTCIENSTFPMTSVHFRFAHSSEQAIKKKKSLSTLGIKNSWKYEKDLILTLKSKKCFLLISQWGKLLFNGSPLNNNLPTKFMLVV